MRGFLLTICMAGLVLTACNNNTGDKKPSDSTTRKPGDWVPIDSATEMKAWMEYAAPGEAHKTLAKSNGNWTGQVTSWAAIDAPPTTSTATVVNKMIMGGLYQESDYNGNFMGMPFQGMGITGYDNYRKKYLSTWVDNMGSGILSMQGSVDSATKAITFTGSMINPANGKRCIIKQVNTIVDDNNQLMEMYGPDPKTGKQFKDMEIKLTRKK